MDKLIRLWRVLIFLPLVFAAVVIVPVDYVWTGAGFRYPEWLARRYPGMLGP